MGTEAHKKFLSSLYFTYRDICDFNHSMSMSSSSSSQPPPPVPPPPRVVADVVIAVKSCCVYLASLLLESKSESKFGVDPPRSRLNGSSTTAFFSS